MRKVDSRPVDWREDDVKGPVAPGHPPPVTVKDRVAEVKHPTAAGLDQPRDLRIAEAVDCGQRSQSKGAGVNSLPCLHRTPPQAGAIELEVGLRQPEVLDIGPSGPDGLMNQGVGSQGGCEGPRVGVISVQVADKPGNRPTPSVWNRQSRQSGTTGLFSQGREYGGRVDQGIDDDRLSVCLDLDPRPSQPSDLHLLSFYRTVVRYHQRMPRRSPAAVAVTKTAVTEAAVDLASVEGLGGLTIGGLAGETAMRKSSVFSLFGSKQELQMATLEAAVEQFTSEVWNPIADERPGRARLLALCDSWLAYHEREVMPGGCFLTTATIEFDARPGPLRDRVADVMTRWHGVLEREVAVSIEAGELPAETEPADVAFALNALAAAASYGFHLSRDPEVFERARRSMRQALGD